MPGRYNLVNCHKYRIFKGSRTSRRFEDVPQIAHMTCRLRQGVTISQRFVDLATVLSHSVTA